MHSKQTELFGLGCDERSADATQRRLQCSCGCSRATRKRASGPSRARTPKRSTPSHSSAPRRSHERAGARHRRRAERPPASARRKPKTPRSAAEVSARPVVWPTGRGVLPAWRWWGQRRQRAAPRRHAATPHAAPDGPTGERRAACCTGTGTGTGGGFSLLQTLVARGRSLPARPGPLAAVVPRLVLVLILVGSEVMTPVVPQ